MKEALLALHALLLAVWSASFSSMPAFPLARKAHGSAKVTLVTLLMLILPAHALDPWRSAACEALLGRTGDSEAASSPLARIVSPVQGSTVAGDAIRVDFSILEGGGQDWAGMGFPSLSGSGVVAAVLLDGALVAYGVQLGKPLLLAPPPQVRRALEAPTRHPHLSSPALLSAKHVGCERPGVCFPVSYAQILNAQSSRTATLKSS